MTAIANNPLTVASLSSHGEPRSGFPICVLRNAGLYAGVVSCMRIPVRVLCVAACLFALTGCASAPDFKLSALMPGGAEDSPPPPPAASEITGSTLAEEPNLAVKDALLGGDDADDLTLGK